MAAFFISTFETGLGMFCGKCHGVKQIDGAVGKIAKAVTLTYYYLPIYGLPLNLHDQSGRNSKRFFG
jgi:hypothetical protein